LCLRLTLLVVLTLLLLLGRSTDLNLFATLSRQSLLLTRGEPHDLTLAICRVPALAVSLPHTLSILDVEISLLPL